MLALVTDRRLCSASFGALEWGRAGGSVNVEGYPMNPRGKAVIDVIAVVRAASWSSSLCSSPAKWKGGQHSLSKLLVLRAGEFMEF